MTELSGPTTQSERILSLDVLRGFAVLGILVMNIQAFSMIGGAYFNPTAYGDLTGLNYLVWLFSHLLADMKFMAIFSMLFGAGMVLMAERLEATDGSRPGPLPADLHPSPLRPRPRLAPLDRGHPLLLRHVWIPGFPLPKETTEDPHHPRD